MSALARHPVHWPRMKIRGKRRRRLAAERHETRRYFPHARITDQVDGRITFGFDVAAPPPPGPPGGPPPAAGAASYMIMVTTVRDGFGRVVAPRKPTPKPKPKRKPAGEFTLNFTVDNQFSSGIDALMSKVMNMSLPVVDPRPGALIRMVNPA